MVFKIGQPVRVKKSGKIFCVDKIRENCYVNSTLGYGQELTNIYYDGIEAQAYAEFQLEPL